MYLRKNKICWRYLNISQDIAVYHLVQMHIVLRVTVTVAGQASGSDSRLSLIPALTRSHCQPEAADSEPEPRTVRV